MSPSKSSTYLYGMLDISFYEGKNCVAETPIAAHTPGPLKGVFHSLESAVGLERTCSDCYCIVSLHSARIARSRIYRDPNPKWNEQMRVFCAHKVTDVTITVKDDNDIGANFIGEISFPVNDILKGKLFEGWFDLLDKDGKVTKRKSALRLRLHFFPAEMDISYSRGIGDGRRLQGIVHTFFPLRQGCNMRLLQDAHIDEGSIPPISLTGGKPYYPFRNWEGLYEDIKNARHLIYLSGWSVNYDTVLVRSPEASDAGAVGVTLGDLLVRKADAGVRVLVMVWDDRFSKDIPYLQKGVMGTGDQKTEEFFRGTKVKCFLCPRDPSKSLSLVQGFKIGNMFTHHQKTAVMDAPYSDSNSTKRRLVGYVGGVDVCRGRFDTPSHSLFRTLATYHQKDFHQKCLSNASMDMGGPRQPWHDIHSRVEGPIAWDVLYNFEQRWLHQAGSMKDALYSINNSVAIVNPEAVLPEPHPGVWSVQLLRSIDTGSVMGFPDSPTEADEAGLVPGKNNVTDRSCQDAYIQAIRRSRNFIYIENQYFLGSSHLWDGDNDASCTHLIPAEIMLKIIKKIEAGEGYRAYVVLPMFPDGIPEGGSVQAVLYWQSRTMMMMYSAIARALQENGRVGEHPQDYLSFYCLGNRESVSPGGEASQTKYPEPGSDYHYAQKHRRFMIYVHSKLMIVDDELVIIGSANINQRSMDGARDTELAIAAFQNHHTIDTSPLGVPRGEVHGFRLALWAEHTGQLENVFLDPPSLDCMRRMRAIGERHWEEYVGEEVVDMVGHLMNYPIAVSQDGTVATLPGFEFFPDTKAPVLGTKSTVLPEILTT